MKRCAVYTLRSPLARPSESVFVALRALSKLVDFVIVLLPRGKSLTPPSRVELATVADVVWTAPETVTLANQFLAVRERMGMEELAGFDEIHWLDDSMFGPIGPLEEIPIPVNASRLDAWTLLPPDSPGEVSIEFNWLTTTPSLVMNDEFWAVVRGGFSGQRELLVRLLARRFKVGAVYAPRSIKEQAFMRDSLTRLLAEGIPFLPFQTLTMDPLVCDRWGIVPRETFDDVVARGYPAAALWDYLLRSVPPRDWYTNLSMAEVFDERVSVPLSDPQIQDVDSLRTAVILHVFYVDMLDELMSYASNVPGSVKVVITTDSAEKVQQISARLPRYPKLPDVDVRQVTSNRGRDVTAFLVDCADVLRDESIDLIVKLHSKKSVQDPASVSEFFQRHLFQNLLATPEYARSVWSLFAQEPLLGMVFPPTIHMGLPTMGHAWGANKKPALSVAARLGITIPFDQSTPLSPYGSMMIARRSALEPVLRGAYSVEDFPDHSQYRDGSLAHVLERLLSYVVFSSGFYAKSVSTARNAAVREPVLEFKAQAIGEYLPPHALQQMATFKGVGEFWPIRNALLRTFEARLSRRAPGLARALRGVARKGVRWLARRRAS